MCWRPWQISASLKAGDFTTGTASVILPRRGAPPGFIASADEASSAWRINNVFANLGDGFDLAPAVNSSATKRSTRGLQSDRPVGGRRPDATAVHLVMAATLIIR